MRLTLSQEDGPEKEFQSTKERILIGRALDCDVVIQHRAVSRKHTAISWQPGKKVWLVEDLGSANKTFLNDRVVNEATALKTNDRLRIGNSVFEIDLENKPKMNRGISADETVDGEKLDLEASLTTPKHETIVRKPDARHAPAMRLSAKRLTDFAQATDTLAECENLDQLLLTLVDVAIKQFDAFHVWCALREQPSGPMNYHVGKRRDGQKVELTGLQLQDKIAQAVERGQSMVLPRVSAQMESKDRIRSALITPVTRRKGCYGVLYVDNAMVHEHYSLSDLDYLMFLAMHAGSILKRFLSH